MELVRGLLREQHPDLADRPLTPLGEGWDNMMFRLGQHFVVRLPRRSAAEPLAVHEQRWLPQIAAALDLPVPVPVRHGRPSDHYPWPWSITRWIEGRPAHESPVGARARWAGRLARFMARLHQPAPADAPHNPVRGVPLAVRDEVFRERLARARHPRVTELLACWEAALRAPVYAGEPVWVHGDPHPLNLLVHRGGLAAVIDFGDIGAGDPASDLATGWQTFGWEGRADFVVRYSQEAGADEALWQRARGWATMYAVNSLVLSAGSPEFTAIAEHTITQLLDAPDAGMGRD